MLILGLIWKFQSWVCLPGTGRSFSGSRFVLWSQMHNTLGRYWSWSWIDLYGNKCTFELFHLLLEKVLVGLEALEFEIRVREGCGKSRPDLILLTTGEPYKTSLDNWFFPQVMWVIGFTLRFPGRSIKSKPHGSLVIYLFQTEEWTACNLLHAHTQRHTDTNII